MRRVDIKLGFQCNNQCRFCVQGNKRKKYPDKTTKQIKEILRKTCKKYDGVVFTGGEPTIREDILQLIKYAKDLGYGDIGLSTNGRMLSYNDFAKKIIKSGVRRINFSLYGHNKELHNAITRTPESFEQTIQGIKNIQKFPEVTIIVNTVVSRLNYRHLSELGRFLSSLKIKFFNILDLIPDGYAKDFYETLVVRTDDLSGALNNLENILARFELTTFFDFPLCLFKPEMRDNSSTVFITAEERIIIAKQVGYKPGRFKREKGNIYLDVHKERIEICQSCQFFKECGGVWQDYLNLYGPKEITALAEKHKCLLKI